MNYVGYTISNVQDRLIIKVKTSRISKLKRAIRRAITGQCVSTVWAFTPGKLLLQNIYRLLSTRDSWKSDLTISKEVIIEFKWWWTAVNHWNSVCTRPVAIQVTIKTDAPNLGLDAVCNGDWNKRVSCTSSNYRELMAILLAITPFRTILKYKSVHILSENITSIPYINHKGEL